MRQLMGQNVRRTGEGTEGASPVPLKTGPKD